jgi:hypothetical protein
MDQSFTIQGNELNGYCVLRNVDGVWKQITKRYETYDDADRACTTFVEALHRSKVKETHVYDRTRD